MKRSELRKKLKRVARLHAWVSGGLMALYIGLSVVYSPDFFLSDVRDKFRAFADDTIAITARVLAPPVKPVVTATPVCASGNLSVALDWADDENSISFDVSRDGLPLVTGLTASAYSDAAVVVGTSYSYEVTAWGPMGPGLAISDPIVVTTPAVCGMFFVPALSITSFDGKAIGSFGGDPKSTDRQPEFSGTTNIPNADITVLINGTTVISAMTQANVNGYWVWEPPIDLPRGTQTIFVTATDPSDPSVTVSANLAFRIVKKDSDDKENEEERATVPVTRVETDSEPPRIFPELPGETEPSAEDPLSVTFMLGSSEVYQGRKLGFSVAFSEVVERLRGASAIARYTVIDSDGRERFSFFENIVIDEGRIVSSDTAIPPYFKGGNYRIMVEILVDRYDVSRERTFSVAPLPILSPGGGFVIMYAEFLSRIGTIAFLLLLLLLLWAFVFSREYMLYLRAFRHITERNLARAGFFGNGKGLST